MAAAFKAGIAYFAIVFTAGFLLGTVRTLLVSARIGGVAATLVELPIILVVAWLASRYLVRAFAIAPGIGNRLVMGVTAFALLMLAEFGLSVFVFGRPAADFAGEVSSTAGLIGLAGQIAFGLMPLIVGRGGSRRE